LLNGQFLAILLNGYLANIAFVNQLDQLLNLLKVHSLIFSEYSLVETDS
jgi:hypothetical protein